MHTCVCAFAFGTCRIFEQRMIRLTNAHAKIHQKLRCSHTHIIDTDQSLVYTTAYTFERLLKLHSL